MDKKQPNSQAQQVWNMMTIHCRKQVLILWSASFCGRWDNLSGPQPVPIAFFPGYSSGACKEQAVCQMNCSGSSHSSHPAPAFADGCLAALPSHEGYTSGMWQENDPWAGSSCHCWKHWGAAGPVPVPEPCRERRPRGTGRRTLSAAGAAAHSPQPRSLEQFRTGCDLTAPVCREAGAAAAWAWSSCAASDAAHLSGTTGTYVLCKVKDCM